jgi:methylglutaconyl-CoA hydratase
MAGTKRPLRSGNENWRRMFVKIDSSLEIEIDNKVARVWINRPEKHNSFNDEVIRELTEAFRRLDDDSAVRVVVLGGRGKSFSAGGDLDWMRRAAGYSTEENLRDARKLSGLFSAIHDLGKPTIARVHGAAFGGGLGLTAACDIAVATTKALFATTEVRFGIVPGAISPYVIKAIGARACHRYFLTAERFDAHEAHRISLVHEVCEPDEVDARIEQITNAVLEGGPLAQRAAKNLIKEVGGRPIDRAVIEDASRHIANIRSTPEAREGLTAFLEKRKASWID